jgi:uncharacterized RDD family membrane protein YckC
VDPTGGYRAYASEDVVTGEGVPVELPVATTLVRTAAVLIDIALAVLLLVLVGMGTSFLTFGASDAVANALALVTVVLVTVGLPAAQETLTRGRTVGKFALGLRVVRDDGGPITSRHALTRALIGFVEIWLFLGVPALVASVMNTRGKRLGDMAAGTYVVTQRSRMRLLDPPQMPEPLRAWARGADVAALPPGLTVAVRQFLARSTTLTPQSRALLGEELLAEVMRYVAPPPPPGLHGEYVLAAVVAERRRRDLERLDREQRLRERVVSPDPLLPPRP